MRILVACEYSGIARDAFIERGHDVISCDLEPSDSPGPHYQGDVFDLLSQEWDLIVAFPPCTHLSVSGARWFEQKRKDGRQQEGIDFFMQIANAECGRIAIENPVGIMSSVWRKPDQIVNPYEFGDEATKKTCLWLKGLPPLVGTKLVGKGKRVQLKSGKSLPEWYSRSFTGSITSEERTKMRSKTFPGIAKAMAGQWG